MDQENPTPAPVAPSLDATSRPCEINLVTDLGQAPCTCWVSLYRKGSLAANEILKEADLARVFHQIQDEGIAETENLMLSDATTQPPRMLYLVPMDPRVDWEDLQREMAKTVFSWAPERLGFYVPPNMVAEPEAHALLRRLLDTLIPVAPTREYYVYVGAHGTNSILNGTLKVKEDLRRRNVDVAVFH